MQNLRAPMPREIASSRHLAFGWLLALNRSHSEGVGSGIVTSIEKLKHVFKRDLGSDKSQDSFFIY